ncbi:hypothetical protein [Bradyrhizobium japonicum]|uniref:hypothetical protein n=1 Tax=Bradyrhizobium japonicum TaxID=375 RepID=UPI00200D3A23|nr:hypothetical protein [Bradyrhizobium japonicum]UQE01148.1 hypothetical protein JEY30_13960 [Bradyrhizobium japonicum]
MKRLALTAALLIGTATSAYCLDRLTPAEIASLPQDQVAVAKGGCAAQWPNDFEMRLYCEDKQFSAMKKLIDRGSVSAKGDKL